MTHDDSVQIEAASPARGRALPRMRRRERASRTRGRETSPIPAMAERRPRGRGDRRRDPMGNFPPCKALKNHKMGKESRYRANPLRSRPNVSLQRGRRGARFASLTIRAFSTRLDRRRKSPAGSIAIVDPTVAATARRKLSPSQSLENSQNGKIISISREPVPQAGGTAVQFPRRHRRQLALYLRSRWMASPSARNHEMQLQSIRPYSPLRREQLVRPLEPSQPCMPIDGNLSP